MRVAAKPIARWLASAGLLAVCFLSPQLPVTSPGAVAGATPDSEPPPADGVDPVQVRNDLFEHLGAAAWHRQGERGHGVKIAVLDSGFRGYGAYLGHALPANVVARSFRS